jgi:DnaJ-class molecular chaperone
VSDDWDYSDTACPKCQSDMATRRCGDCGGEGYVEDEDDWEGWHDDERCDMCNGKGFEEWCRECGWDATYKRFLNPEYERAWKEKHSAA